jgi:hypothetical protein
MRPAYFIAVILVVLCSASPAVAKGFSDWAAIVVAGDWHADSGAPSAVFDNARRDIAGELVAIGFSPANIVQFSVRPKRYPAAALRTATAQHISGELWDLTNRTSAGCLAYFTSHGSPDGIVVGDAWLSPDQMARIVGNSCGTRPTVVIVSACYSGVFVPALKAPNRIVLTAAAADRSSFGCGETDKYTYFDSCAVRWLTKAGDFPDFGKDVIACIGAREKKEKVDLPSKPQLFVGAEAANAVPRWK